MRLTLVSINTWKCDGDYDLRMSALAAGLRDLDADLVCCQECFLSGGADTLSFLSGALGMHAAYQGARAKPRWFRGCWVDSQSGLGILSTFPIVENQAVVLPSSPEDGGRVAQLASLDLGEGRLLRVVNVHLTHLRNARELRRKQLEALPPADVMAGDFNALFDDPALQTFLSLHRGRGFSNWVDHIFSLDPDCACADGAVVLDQPCGGVLPSDHFGIKVQLNLLTTSDLWPSSTTSSALREQEKTP